MKDYIEQANRTCSDQFYWPGPVHPKQLVAFFENMQIIGSDADNFKKAIFYGRTDVVSHDYDPMDIDFPLDKNFLHGLLGIVSEASELTEAVVNSITMKDGFDRTNFIEEMGDIMWYLAIMAKALGVTFEEIQEKNIAKLRARFPDKFTEDNANNRDLDKEREVLEQPQSGEPGDGHLSTFMND